MSEQTRKEQRPAAEPGESVESLAERPVTADDATSVTGGALNAYISKAQGEKQGSFKGG